jgi:hypothetical protein
MTRERRAFIRGLTESSFKYRDTVLTATPAFAATTRIVGFLSEAARGFTRLLELQTFRGARLRDPMPRLGLIHWRRNSNRVTWPRRAAIVECDIGVPSLRHIGSRMDTAH